MATSTNDATRDARESPSILAKAFELLRAFDTSHRVMTLTELSRASGLPKSTVHRLLARLVQLDAIEQVGDGYRISVSLAALASSAPANLMRELAVPHMARLHNWSGHTIALGVLRGLDMVVLDQVGSFEWHAERNLVGARLPATSAAMGKVLLAWDPRDALAEQLPSRLLAMTPESITDPGVLMHQLREVRATNLAHQWNETMDGVAGIATAILMRGSAVGALGLIYPSEQTLRPQAADALRNTAAQLAAEIGAKLAAVGQEHRWMPGRMLSTCGVDAADS